MLQTAKSEHNEVINIILFGYFVRGFYLNLYDDSTIQAPQMCTEHNKNLKHYCRQCDIGVCNMCVRKGHKGHAVVPQEMRIAEIVDECLTEETIKVTDW